MPTEHGFPPGDSAFQTRYIEAFKGLTEIIAGGQHQFWPGEGTSVESPEFNKWWEMFNTLIAREEEDGQV